MSKLMAVKETVQQIALTITAVLNIETMILDENLQIIAGTGKYAEQIGAFEAESLLPEEYMYKYILRTGETCVIDDNTDPLYGPELYGEIGEISCAIPYRTGCVGIISLVAFNDDQYSRLIGNKDSICPYLESMAELISSFLSNHESFTKLNIQTKMLNEIVNSSPHCIVVINKEGYITEANKKAVNNLLEGQDKFWGLLGKHIDTFWAGAHKLLVDNKEGLNNQEFSFNNNSNKFLLSTKVVLENNNIERVIVFFDNLIEAKENAYRILDDQADGFGRIKGNSNEINRVKKIASHISASASTILITGESGTGKELFARAIHYSSTRRSAPFITINCGAIPESLMESELFGYEEGAFTGAARGGHKGKFEIADGGTLFIDEIGDLPLHMQIKLLHVLQNRSFERIGGNESIKVDVRIIAATNKNLDQMCEDGTFRQDLYYRLNVIPIVIPPLRERLEDVPVLANHFLAKYAQISPNQIQGFSKDAMDALLSHEWKGNVRELENTVEYSVNMAQHSTITRADLPPAFSGYKISETNPEGEAMLKDNMSEYENMLILKHLQDVENGKMTKTELAGKLGISRSSLYRKINRLKNNKL